MKNEATRVRYHEAGHAVIARVLRIPVIKVTARPSRKFRGVTTIDRTAKQKNEASFLESEIKVLLAGSYAEVKQYPDSDWKAVQCNCIHDWFAAYHCADHLVQIRRLPRPERMDISRQYPATILIVERSAAETEQLLEAHWAAIVRVAKALHRSVFLEQLELDALIAGRSRRGIPPHCFIPGAITNPEIVS
jgi:hypothetical protein